MEKDKFLKLLWESGDFTNEELDGLSDEVLNKMYTNCFVYLDFPLFNADSIPELEKLGVSVLLQEKRGSKYARLNVPLYPKDTHSNVFDIIYKYIKLKS